MDKREPGVIARPAPPGRRRAPASRNVSSASTQGGGRDKSSSPSPPTDVVALDEGSTISDMSAQVDALGLYADVATEFPASEIPLEEVEKALTGLSRENLVLALKRAKEQMDILDSKMDTCIERNEILESRVNELTSQVKLGEAEIESLQIALQQREERVDELMREQDRDEDEVFEKQSMIERLKKRLEDSEKSRNETERRYHNQTIIADKERQYFSDMESLLQTQKSKASTAHERILASNQELSKENQRLQNLVSQLRLTSRSVSHSVEAKSDDDTTRYSPRRLTDDGEGKDNDRGDMSLVDEHDDSVTSIDIRTLQDEAKALEVEALQADFSALQKSHDMIQAQLQQLQAELALAKTANAEIREQNETYMDILQEKTLRGTLFENGNMLGGRFLDSETEDSEADDVDDVPDEPRKSKRGHRLLSNKSQEQLEAPTSLASELETSDSTDGNRESKRRERRRDRSEVLTDNVEELHKEVWSLRDANQALALYVNKILERIIAKEGYENVLAVDGDEKSKMGTLRVTPNRSNSTRSRITAKDALSPPSIKTTSTKASRRISGSGLLSFIGGGGGGAAAAAVETQDGDEPKTPTPLSPSFASRAKRTTASIDWRALVGAGGPTSPSQQPWNDSIASKIGQGPRKISSSEEREDIHDVEEKEKIRQAMISHGIEVPDHQLKTQRKSTPLGTFFTRVMGTTAMIPASHTEVSNKKEESIIGRGDQHPGPRLTTFDGPPLAMSRTKSGGLDSNGSSSPLSRSEARQRALDFGNTSGSFTEVPRRTSPISSRRSTLARRDTSGSSVGDTSQGESVGGDESYQFNSPVLSNETSLEEDQEGDTSWMKTFKKMSVLGTSTTRT